VLPVRIPSELQPAILDVRHAVHQIFLKQPRRQLRCREPRIPRRATKEKHFLPAGKNARTQYLRKKLAQPRATRKNKLPCRNSFPSRRDNLPKTLLVATRRRYLRDLHLHPVLARVAH